MKVKVRIDRCIGCKSCEMACARRHSDGSPLGVAPRIRVKHGQVVRAGGEAGANRPYVITCRHCANAKCVTACIAGAIYQDDKGRVMYDRAKCVGCWMCIMICPFGAIHRDLKEKKVAKCDLCDGREVPACVEACKVGALEIDMGRKD
jgi:anaerobic carbon-monoxide dehydrogenase iron sulfur subunit